MTMIKSLYKLEFEEEEPTLTESTQQKAADKVITLHDDEPEMVARMLLCLYTSDSPTQLKERDFSGYLTVEEFLKKGCRKFQTDSFEHETNPLLVHSKMYAIAHKYDMPGVQAIVLQSSRSISIVGRTWNILGTPFFMSTVRHRHLRLP